MVIADVLGTNTIYNPNEDPNETDDQKRLRLYVELMKDLLIKKEELNKILVEDGVLQEMFESEGISMFVDDLFQLSQIAPIIVQPQQPFVQPIAQQVARPQSDWSASSI